MTAGAPRWVRWWFRGGAAYGIAALVPCLFLPRPAAGPQWLYGFVGTALAFQLIYWTIGGDPARYRPLMPVAVLAKLGFFLPCMLLYAGGHLDASTALFAAVDAVLAVGFAAAWRATGEGPRRNGA